MVRVHVKWVIQKIVSVISQQRIYRQVPITFNNGNNYRKFIYTYYEDRDKNKCIRHGGYDNEHYTVSFKVEEPAIETVSAIYYNMKRMFNLNNSYKTMIAGFKLTTMSCEVWSYIAPVW